MSGSRIFRWSLWPSRSPTKPSGVAEAERGGHSTPGSCCPDRTQAWSPPAFCFVVPLEDKNQPLFSSGTWRGRGEQHKFTPPPSLGAYPAPSVRESLDHVGSGQRSHSCSLPLGLVRTFHTQDGCPNALTCNPVKCWGFWSPGLVGFSGSPFHRPGSVWTIHPPLGRALPSLSSQAPRKAPHPAAWNYRLPRL